MITREELRADIDAIIGNALANMVPMDILLSELRRAENEVIDLINS